MSQIANETQFRTVVAGLDNTLQRQLAGLFTRHILDLTDDNRIIAGSNVAANPDASPADLAASFRAVKAATIESHTRCGSDGDWKAQATYFTARACEAALMSGGYKRSGPALQAATSARMARTAYSIDDENDDVNAEREAQYHILNEFLSKRGLS